MIWAPDLGPRPESGTRAGGGSENQEDQRAAPFNDKLLGSELSSEDNEEIEVATETEVASKEKEIEVVSKENNTEEVEVRLKAKTPLTKYRGEYMRVI
jgi:hypothetical protein